MNILAIDPGPEQSAIVYLDGRVRSFIVDNEVAARHVMESTFDVLAIESVACFGMPVGAEVFSTCEWIGIFCWVWARHSLGDILRIPRTQIKNALCGSARAKDSNIRQALIDRFGGSRAAAMGTKAKPGPLYGVKSHAWSALAVAVVAEQMLREKNGE